MKKVAPPGDNSRVARLGVLVSGEGTNLQAILDGCAGGTIAARAAVVLCSRPGARAMERAEQAGVPAVLCPPPHGTDFQNRQGYDRAILEVLEEHNVHYVALAGFMHLVGRDFLQRFGGRVLNVHPSLLPAYRGLHSVRRALQAGEVETGCSVHFVDEGMDTGPVVVQGRVPVLTGDSVQTLTRRIQSREHHLFPWALDMLVRGLLVMEDGRVSVLGALAPGAKTPLNDLPGDAPVLG